jgi:hypothetical protein
MRIRISELNECVSTGGCYWKIIWKNFVLASRTQKYLQKHSWKLFVKTYFFAKSYAKTKLFAKTVPGSNIFRENFRKNENFRENFRKNEHFRKTKFREKRANCRLFSLFMKMKKEVFVSTLLWCSWKPGKRHFLMLSQTDTRRALYSNVHYGTPNKNKTINSCDNSRKVHARSK